MKTIFGEEAPLAAAIINGSGGQWKLDNLTKIIKESDGKTEELVAMQDNLGGDFKEFQSAYEAVGTDPTSRENYVGSPKRPRGMC